MTSVPRLIKTLSVLALLLGAFTLYADGQAVSEPSGAPAPSTAMTEVLTSAVESLHHVSLPGKGLSQHSFLLTGEWDHRKSDQTLFIVREGQVVWSYSIPIKDAQGTLQELGDATMLSNGNIVFCRKVGASEITPEKKIVWDLAAQPGCEIHSVQPIGLDRVLVTQNGNPAKLMLINKKTGTTEKEITLPATHPEKSHLQFRRVHQTKNGTYLAAHLDGAKVSEYNDEGKEIWSYPIRSPWSAVRLQNGNTLITAYPSIVREVDQAGKVVWEFTQKDAPDYNFYIFQEAGRLANGNTVICNWCPVHLKDPKNWPGTVQVIEVTPKKKIVWALSAWGDPVDLGPASSIQLLDQPGKAENGDLQR